MFLCFGTYANTLKTCSISGTTNRTIVSTLVSTIDPDNRYGEKNNDTAVSRLMNCDRNFPTVTVEPGIGVIRTIDAPQTNIIALSKNVDVKAVEERFDSVLELLAEDKKQNAIAVMLYIIEHDDTLRNEHSSLFTKCLGDTAAHIVERTQFDLRSFLSRLFLYTVLLNDNTKGKPYLPDIKTGSFQDRIISYFSGISLLQQTLHSGSESDLITGELQYMEGLKKKFNNIPTFLYKESLEPFSKYYVPNDIEWHERVPGDRYSYIRNRVSNLSVEKLKSISHYAFLSGTGGLGKSMMMRRLLLSSCENYSSLGVIPIFVTLKDFDVTYKNLLEFIMFSIQDLWTELTPKKLDTLLKEGKALLLFDGLDEIPYSLIAFFTKQLNSFMDRYGDNLFVISSRPYSNFQTFARFTVLYLQPFTKEQALTLVDLINYRADSPKLQKRFRELLDKKLYYSHKGFSDNPLLLSIMLLTFEMDAEVPMLKHIFYQEAYMVLSKRHDASKDSYTRPMKTGWSSDEFAKYFSFFCAKTYSAGKISFTYTDMETYFKMISKKYGLKNISVDDFIYDAINNICIMYQDGYNYGFIHRSFQEYFCAKFFHNQLDENLKKVIPIFDRRETNKKDDTALSMLFDMKPQAVEKYLIYPYLEQFISNCEAQNGLWTFLENIYPDYEIADGSAYADDDNQMPSSNLYAFILAHYDIPLMNVVLSDIIGIKDARCLEMVFREDIEEDVWEDDVPFDYVNEYGEPEVTGQLYILEWSDIRNKHSLINLREYIESERSPFYQEYQSIKELLEELKDKIETLDLSEDPFENMF